MPMQRLTADEKVAKRRQYTRENRQLWKTLGFRMMSAPVHDDDREEALAELEVMRCMKMAKFAEDKSTGIATLVQLGRRNLTPPKTPKEMTEFLKGCEGLDNFADIEHAVVSAKKAHEVFRGSAGAINQTSEEMVRQRLFAKEVAYGNLAAAWFKLAQARAAVGKKTSVFGLRNGVF